MDSIDYAAKCNRINPGQPSTGLTGVLFVDGFSVCGVEFHLNNLLGLPWPHVQKNMFTFDGQHAAFLAEVLEQNTFKMIVLPALVGSLEKQCVQFSGGRQPAPRQMSQVIRVLDALKTAVEQKGATLVLFCCESVDSIYKGIFNKRWKQGMYVRTDCFRTGAAAAAIPKGPSVVNAKAVHLDEVPQEEQWYVSTEGSLNNSILFQALNTTGPPLGAGLCAVAAGAAGAGRVVYLGDVNAEIETCQVVQQLAHEIFQSEGNRARQQHAHAVFAPLSAR